MIHGLLCFIFGEPFVGANGNVVLTTQQSRLETEGERRQMVTSILFSLAHSGHGIEVLRVLVAA